MRGIMVSTLIVLIFAANSSIAQPQYNVEYITTENGLPSDGIKGLQWDEHTGFLWIATELGLVRYNGNTFVVFDKENVPNLKSEKIFPLSKDTHGNIFAACSGDIFQVYANKLIPIHSYTESKTVPGFLQISPSKTLPLGSRIDINVYYDRLLPIGLNQYIIHYADTLWMYDQVNNRKKFLASVPSRNLSFVIGKNIFCYNGYDQFSLYDSTSHELKKIIVSEDIDNKKSKLPAGKKNLYWEVGMEYPVLVAGNNAWVLKYKDGKIQPCLICTEIPGNSSVKFAQYWEKGDILFLGTGSKGILIIRKNYLDNFKRNSSDYDESNAIYSQILLPNGNVLANTGDILGPSTKPVKYLPVNEPFHNNIFTTKDSILWYTSKDSLYHYDYKKNVRTYTCQIPGSLYLAFATSGDSLFVASKNGIYSIKNDRLTLLSEFNNLGDPFDMVEDQPGILALATTKGLYRYHIKSASIDTALKMGSPVRALWKYKSYLFIGTYGDGIYILKNGSIKKIPLDNNNYLAYTHCFILDDKGYCWMSTNRGLLKASLEDMINAFDYNTSFIYYHFFGKNEGMNITEMNGGCTPCGIKLQNNDISFPTMDGALWIDPFVPVRLPSGNIFIDQIIVNAKRIESSTPNDLLLNASTHDISFSLGFSAWCDNENVYIQYSLDSSSILWQKINAQHPVIRLSNLPYGKYTLYIRELKGFGAKNYAISKINFRIDAPWYLKWWGVAFWALIFLSIIAIISIIANRRSLMQQRRLRSLLDKKTEEILTQNEKLEKNDRIKTRLISIISHDIITPLKYLHLTSKYLFEGKTSLPKNLRNENLEEIVNTSRELELLSTNILNWIKYQNEERRIVKETINLYDLLEGVFTILKSLAHKNNIALVNNIPNDVSIFQFVDPLRIVLYNLIVNSINFTQQGSISISCKYVMENIEIEVKDTGLGMPVSKIKNIMSDHIIISSTNINKKSGHGLGYLIIKDLLKMIEGEFYIESKINVGTSVYIIFPPK